MGGTDSLKVTLKLFQVAQMGLWKRKRGDLFSLGEQLTSCRTVEGRGAGATGKDGRWDTTLLEHHGTSGGWVCSLWLDPLQLSSHKAQPQAPSPPALM